ncbi:MAG: hypothetical protein Q7T04_00705 [Dehalococcoidia bacterium]|nr:hypothetical protein [Dehalococcoidia bacterium]
MWQPGPEKPPGKATGDIRVIDGPNGGKIIVNPDGSLGQFIPANPTPGVPRIIPIDGERVFDDGKGNYSLLPKEDKAETKTQTREYIDENGDKRSINQTWGETGQTSGDGTPIMGWVDTGNSWVTGKAPIDTRQQELELKRKAQESEDTYNKQMLELERAKLAATTQAAKDAIEQRQRELAAEQEHNRQVLAQQAAALAAEVAWRNSQTELDRQQGEREATDRAATRADEKQRYLAGLKANPRSWIEYGEASGQTPLVPQWLADISSGALVAGQPINEANKKSIAAITRAMWDRLNPSQQQMLEGYLSFLGSEAGDYYKNLWWMGGQGAVQPGNAAQQWSAFSQVA